MQTQPICETEPARDDTRRAALRTHGVGRSTVFLDQYSGAVLRVDDFSRASRAHRAHMIDQALHMGTAFSLPVHIAFSLAGVTLVLMAATGTLIWWRREE